MCMSPGVFRGTHDEERVIDIPGNILRGYCGRSSPVVPCAWRSCFFYCKVHSDAQFMEGNADDARRDCNNLEKIFLGLLRLSSRQVRVACVHWSFEVVYIDAQFWCKRMMMWGLIWSWIIRENTLRVICCRRSRVNAVSPWRFTVFFSVYIEARRICCKRLDWWRLVMNNYEKIFFMVNTVSSSR